MNLAAISIVRSGVDVETRAFGQAAANIAHMNDTIRPADASATVRRNPGQDPDPNKETDAYQPAYLARIAQKDGGVRAEPVKKDPPHELSFKPDDPNADENGLVARPSIEIENEFVHMMLARRALQANISAVRTADALSGTFLNAKI